MSTTSKTSVTEIAMPIPEEKVMDLAVCENSTQVIYAILMKKLAKLAAEPMSDARRPIVEAAGQLYAYFFDMHAQLSEFLAKVSEDDAANQAMNRRLVSVKNSKELKYVNGWWSGFGKIAPQISFATENAIGVPLASSLWMLKLSKLHLPQYINVLMDRLGFLYVKLTLAKNLYAKKEPFLGKLLWSEFDDNIRSFVDKFWTEVVSPDDRANGKLFNFKQVYDSLRTANVSSNSTSSDRSNGSDEATNKIATKNHYETLASLPAGEVTAQVPSKPTKTRAVSKLAGYSDAAKKDLKKTVAKSLEPEFKKSVTKPDRRTNVAISPVPPVAPIAPIPSGPSWADIMKKHTQVESTVGPTPDNVDAEEKSQNGLSVLTPTMYKVETHRKKGSGYKPKFVARYEPKVTNTDKQDCHAVEIVDSNQSEFHSGEPVISDISVNDDIVDDNRQQVYDFSDDDDTSAAIDLTPVSVETVETVEKIESIKSTKPIEHAQPSNSSGSFAGMVRVDIATFQDGHLIMKPVYMTMFDYIRLNSSTMPTVPVVL